MPNTRINSISLNQRNTSEHERYVPKDRNIVNLRKITKKSMGKKPTKSKRKRKHMATPQKLG
jgi:hypothetical protein